MQDRAPHSTRDATGQDAWRLEVDRLAAAGDFAGAERLLAARPRPEPVVEARLRLAWGRALLAQEDLAGAESQLARARDLEPGNPNGHAELGHVYLRQGRMDDAEASFAQVLKIVPRHANSLVNRGVAMRALGRADDAEASYRAALAVEPGHLAASRNLAIHLADLDRHQEGLEVAGEALAHARHPEILIARGDALYRLGRFSEALDSYLEAAALAADPYEVTIKVAVARAALRQYPRALEELDRAVALRPDDELAYNRRAPVRLVTGDFAGGWSDLEHRWRNEPFLTASSAMVSPQVRQHLRLRATVDDLRGRRVLLVGEQGIGDQVMFASIIPDLVRAAASVACVCDARLVRLLSQSLAGVTVVAPEDANVSPSAFDVVLAVGSLGHAFRGRVEDFPGVPYLRPSAQVSERWAERLGPRPSGLRIGVSWRGGTPKTERATRSVALADLGPLLDLPGCETVSLQYGDAREEVEAVNAGLQTGVRIFAPAEIEDFEDLSGLISNLDIVVSVQTAVVHLAGALGRDALVMVPYNPVWRYGATSPTMPWYGSVRLVRQPQPQAWEPVIADVAEALKARLRASGRA